MRLSKEKREEVVADVRRAVTRYHDTLPDHKGPLSHYCLFFAGFTAMRLWEEGVEAMLQAGTVFWRRVRREDASDPNVLPDYGFKFEWGEQALKDFIGGRLPEMHVWVAVPESGEAKAEIIDLTSGFVKDRCINDGLPWTAEYDPPTYVWSYNDQMPQGAHFQVDKKATAIAYQLWENTVRHILHGPEDGGLMIIEM